MPHPSSAQLYVLDLPLDWLLKGLEKAMVRGLDRGRPLLQVLARRRLLVAVRTTVEVQVLSAAAAARRLLLLVL